MKLHSNVIANIKLTVEGEQETLTPTDPVSEVEQKGNSQKEAKE